MFPFPQQTSTQEGVKYALSVQLVHTLLMPFLAAGTDNAAVTCVSISSDQRRLLTGDSRGRVFAWCLPDASGKTNEHWLKDSLAAGCMGPVNLLCVCVCVCMCWIMRLP